MSNNNLGINSFSGPMGEKEPAYGVGETMKVLSRIGVQAPPSVNAPRRSQRAAARRSAAKPAPPPPQPQIAAEGAPVASYGQQLAQFWGALAAEPGASPLVLQLAQEAQSGIRQPAA